MNKPWNFIKIFLFSFLLIFNFQAQAAKQHTLPDSVITGKIKSKIMLDPSLSVFKVDVSTHKGIVKLSGDVNSDTDAGALVELSQATSGVRDVNTNDLHIVNSEQPFTDTAITAKVKGTFLREKLLGKQVPVSAVSVETNNGVVYLSGTVRTKQEANVAIALAKTVNGVAEVESRIKVSKGN